MTINFNVQNPRTGASTAALNESRVDRILNASTLAEAQRMGVFDKLKDWCRGGVKADAIRQIYDQISAPQPNDAQPTDMLHRFERLRNMVTDDQRHQFSVSHNEPGGSAATQWSYALRVGDTEIYHSGPLEDTPGQLSNDFRRCLNLYEGLNRSIDYFQKNCQSDHAVKIKDPAHFIDMRIETMSDDLAVQTQIKAELENPLFSKANFRGFETVEPHTSFHAVFQQGDGEPVRLLLSDRIPSLGEFRQQRLREALQGDAYRNLGELLSRGHLTDEDAYVSALIGSATGDLTTAIDNELRVVESTGREKFEFLRDLQPLNNPWFELLRAQKLGGVSMMDVFFPDSKKDARDLVRFDAARAQLQKVPAERIAEWARSANEELKKLPARDLDSYVLQNTQDLIDDATERDALVKLLDDPFYSTANFKRLEPGVPGSTFRAVFAQDGQERVLEMSDRTATNNEFRGDRVKALLAGSTYANLRGVLSVGMSDSGDAVLGAVANSELTGKLAQTLDLGLDELPRFLQHLRQYGPADLADRTFTMLRNAKVERTNALELLGVNQAPPAQAPLIAPQQLA